MPLVTPGAPPAGYTFAPLQPGMSYFEDAARLYLATWPDDLAGGQWGIIDFFTRYAGRPEYHGLVALREGVVVGFGFGARSESGQWWHDRVAERVGADHLALQDAWGLVDLVVASHHQGRGVGSALMETLLAAQPCPRALLSTEVANTGAQRLYTRYGWSVLHPGFAFNPGDKPYLVMRRELAVGRSSRVGRVGRVGRMIE
ncbi:MAG: GNAT family N-acetyltransferase [Ktedonobacterales bacterium]